MFKPITISNGRLENSSGGAIRYPFGAHTHDLRVMKYLSKYASTQRGVSSNLISRTLDLQVTFSAKPGDV